MAARSGWAVLGREAVNYPSIRIEGAILSPDIIDRLEELPGQKPADFGLDSGTKVKDEIARYRKELGEEEK